MRNNMHTESRCLIDGQHADSIDRAMQCLDSVLGQRRLHSVSRTNREAVEPPLAQEHANWDNSWDLQLSLTIL